jgi:hypothetical protein
MRAVLKRAATMVAAVVLGGCGATTGGGVLPTLSKAKKPVPVPVALDAWARVGDDVWQPSANEAKAGPVDAIGFLVSQRERGDFRFSVDYYVGPNTNSGVFIRCRNPLRITPSTCYEINIWDEHPKQDWRTGSIVTYAKPSAHIEGLERWVKLEIEARGSTIKASFDGVQTVEFDGANVARGRIALQYGGTGELIFRNPRVEPLGP